ncbi:MAG: hypothetical protein H0V44_17635 [Planctomycetes bacterium]|nr:hypothetical protein [Planctomycetota bacterium]
MTPSGARRQAPRLLACAAILGMAIGSVGCSHRGSEPRVVDGVTYGVTTVPFRNRWWHFYERGLSWAAGGFIAEAEADFRRCLALRLTDSRRARTYGMHFVQCFAHRELGAVLVQRGALAEAESELRTSMEQEPSAKAEYLLRRIAERRAAPVVGADPVAAPPIATIASERVPATVAEPMPATLTIDAVEAVATELDQVDSGPQVWITGRVVGPGDVGLWYRAPDGRTQRIVLDASGGFRARVPAETVCVLGTGSSPGAVDIAIPRVALADVVLAGPVLRLEGDETDRVLYGPRVWIRYDAEAAAGLRRLVVSEAEAEAVLFSADISGLRAAGIIPIELDAGERNLRFAVTDAQDRRMVIERSVTVRHPAAQQRKLRATALDLPLQSPRVTAMRPGDDANLLAAIVRDGRFRFVDRRADDVLARELQLVDAGYVDQTTAARAGARLDCRYVVAGTMTRGAADAECFLRLIHCGSGRVIATADAYAEALDPAREREFFAASAGRLRQAFPVIEGQAALADGDVTLGVGERDGVVDLMRFHLLVGEGDGGGVAPSATVEVRKRSASSSRARVIVGSPPASAKAVSE